MKKEPIIIIGGGLSGVTLAYLLKKQGLSFTILEARDRLGGRVFTKYLEEKAPVEMGATWLGKKHQSLTNLLKELGIGLFEQKMGTHAIYHPISTQPHQLVQLPPNPDPSFRISGGSSNLVNTLSSTIDSSSVELNTPIKSISFENDEFIIKSDNKTWSASKVVSTLPPYLLSQTVDLNFDISRDLLETAADTHTWMGESIKIALTFDTPFWRKKGSSGTIFSNTGAIPEFYDHSDEHDQVYALKGFMNGIYYTLSREERLDIILKQLSVYLGEEVKNYTSYHESNWRTEAFTFHDYESHLLPHQNNGNNIFRSQTLNNRFFVSGSETATNYPGYMDGAVESAYYVFKQLMS